MGSHHTSFLDHVLEVAMAASLVIVVTFFLYCIIMTVIDKVVWLLGS